MKKIWVYWVAATGMVSLLLGASRPTQMASRTDQSSPQASHKACSGYTIIEAGKGVDCNGDTVMLIKKYGFYELASRYNDQVIDKTPDIPE